VRVLLVGAGHAHLGVVREAARLRGEGVELCLISPPLFRYSGLATGVLSGALEPAAGEIDVAGLAAAFGVAFHPTEVTAIDRDRGRVTLLDGATLAYDVLSLNIGSRTADPSDLAVQADVWPVKPLSRLLDLRARLEAEIARTGVCPGVVIAGRRSGRTGSRRRARGSLRAPPRDAAHHAGRARVRRTQGVGRRPRLAPDPRAAWHRVCGRRCRGTRTGCLSTGLGPGAGL
jgi:hypothetical protein